MHLRLILFIPLLVFTCDAVNAQAKTTFNDTLYSTALKEKRPVQVILPEGYQPGAADQYDVLYVLDGQWNTSLAEKAYYFLAYAKFIPSRIMIVSVPNLQSDTSNSRDRDFTPTHVSESRTSGGAADFLTFLKNELIPHINKTYPTQPANNTPYGTSLGGLFALYAFLQEPQLFKSILTVEPSIWWDHGYLNRIAAKKLADLPQDPRTLWIASRDGTAFHLMGVDGFDSLLRRQPRSDLDWKVEPYANETHFSTIWKGLYDGLKFTYKGIIPEGNFQLRPMNGRIVKGHPFHLTAYNISPENYMRYTTDGSEPDISSAPLHNDNTFDFSATTSLRIQSISARKENSKSIRCDFVVAEPLPAIPQPRRAIPGGLTEKHGKETEALTGFLEVKSAGYYLFELGDDSTTKVWIGDQLVLGNGQVRQSFILYLQEGFYPYRMSYMLSREKGKIPQVRWRYEKQEEFSVVPKEQLFHLP